MTKSLLFYDKITFSLMGCILRLSRVKVKLKKIKLKITMDKNYEEGSTISSQRSLHALYDDDQTTNASAHDLLYVYLRSSVYYRMREARFSCPSPPPPPPPQWPYNRRVSKGGFGGFMT